jgi:hypothetical protein
MSDRDLTLFGIRVLTSPHLEPPGPPHLRFYPDWRERQARNFSRPSTGKWEPLTYEQPRTNAVMIGGTLTMHPDSLVALRGLLP